MKTLPFIIATFLLVGCAHTSYSTFEGGQIIEGTGGTRQTVQGIDFWNNGTPPRKYRIIGIIDDRRRDNWIGQSGFQKAIIYQVKAAGGDAVILIDQHDKTVGIYNSGQSGSALTTYNGYTARTTYQSYGGVSAPIQDKISKIAVIKYVP